MTDKVKQDQNTGAKRALLEDLFQDYHKHRVQVYRMNFVRGIVFGLGSALGGTVVLALVIWLLVQVPWVSDFVRDSQKRADTSETRE